MSTLPYAIQKDIALASKKEGKENEIVEVADAYEDVLKSGGVPLEAYLNLACLYWNVSDFGFASAFHVSIEYENFIEKRWKEILAEADRSFPSNPETRFWRLYCGCFGGCYDIDINHVTEECEKSIRVPGCSLIPYFHLFSHFRGQRYHSEVRKLLEICRKQITVKNKYIISIIESTLLHNDFST